MGALRGLFRIFDAGGRVVRALVRACAWVLAAGALLVVMPHAAASPQPRFDLPHPDYRGKLLDTKDGQIALRVVGVQGREGVRFQVVKLELECDDGSRRVRTFNIRKADFIGPTVFEEVIARVGGVYRIHGKLRSRGRARGFIVRYENPLDPPESPGDPECTTRGKQRWTARSLRDGGGRVDERPPAVSPAVSGSYTGVLAGNPGSRVSLRLRVERGERAVGRFEASGIEVFCDGFLSSPTLKTTDTGSIPIRFGGRKGFFGDRIIRAANGVITDYSVVIGRLVAGHRALGQVYAFHNPIDEGRANAMRECSTWPQGPWHTQRQGR